MTLIYYIIVERGAPRSGKIPMRQAKKLDSKTRDN